MQFQDRTMRFLLQKKGMANVVNRPSLPQSKARAASKPDKLKGYTCKRLQGKPIAGPSTARVAASSRSVEHHRVVRVVSVRAPSAIAPIVRLCPAEPKRMQVTRRSGSQRGPKKWGPRGICPRGCEEGRRVNRCCVAALIC